MSARERRLARWLVALYPRVWRDRFGDEFEQVLLQDLQDRRGCLRRVVDVIVHAGIARLAAAGLVGRELPAQVQVSRGVRALAPIAAVFLVFAVAIWSALDVGWTWAAPAAEGTRVALLVMSVTLVALVGVAVLAGAVAAWVAVREAARGSGRQRAWLAVAIVSAAAFAAGCGYFSSQWPGVGPSAGLHGSIVPLGLARLAWAGTQWVSAYWLHPGALMRLPDHRLLWTLVSPLLMVMTVAAGLRAVRSPVLSPTVTRTLASGIAIAGILAAVFVAAAASWVLSGKTGPHQVFAPGTVDGVVLIMLALVLIAGGHVMCRVNGALRPASDE